MEFNEDRYYDAMQSQYEDEAKVPFHDYRDLEDKYDELKGSFEDFKSNVLWYLKNNKIDELMKYVSDEVV